MADELTDAEIDVLLERFDQTDPKLQRRIVARLVADAARLREALEFVRDEEPRPPAGCVGEGGETYYSLSRRMKRRAAEAL